MVVQRLAVLVTGALLVSCAPPPPQIGKARLVEADGTVAAPTGTVIEVGVTPVPAKLDGPVRVAIDRDIPYPQALEALQAVRAAGGEPLALVARREYAEALIAPEKQGGDAIKLSARLEGKACVSPPEVEEATCVSRKDHLHIDRAFVRQLLAQAVKEYGLKRVHVVIDPGLSWADAVRAIDGARTCCGPDVKMEVSVEPGW